MKPLKQTWVLSVLAIATVLSVAGCRDPYTEKGWANKPITQPYTFPARGPDGEVIEAGVTWSPELLETGRHAYMHYCYACHGVNGDGKGPAAPAYRPPPRDFRTASFKFGAVRSGELPSDEDLKRIVSGGLHGTAMMEWDIPEVELERIIAFIKTFPQPPCDPATQGQAKCDEIAAQFPDGRPSKWLETYDRGKKAGQLKPIGEPIVVPPEDPWAGKGNEAIAKGQEIYHLKAQCANCHPSYMTRADLSALREKVEGTPMTTFRDNMYKGIVLAAKDNPYHVNLMPPDFTLNPLRSIRRGHEMTDLWRLIASGVGGVMPAWIDGLKPEEIWALSHYVKSLMDLARPENRGALNELRDKLENQPPFQPPPPPPAPAKAVTLKIAADGKVSIDDVTFDDDEKLQEKLSELVAAGPVEITIEAEGDALDADRVLAIHKLVKEAGIEKIALPAGIEPPAEGDDAEGEETEAVEAPEPPEVPIPGDPDALDPKGKTKVPPTTVPEKKTQPVPKPPEGRPTPPPAPKAPPPPIDTPYD